MSRYAEKTSVPSEKSRMEIERTLQRYGASAFAYATDNRHAMIRFAADGRFVQFVLPMPDPNEAKYREYKRGYNTHARSAESALKLYEQDTRQRWRALALAVKAKLEAVETGIATFEQEFLAHIVLPDGTTFGDWASGELARVYETGGMPTSLLALPAAGETS